MTMSEKAQQAQIDATSLAQEYARTDVRRGHWLGSSLTTLAIAGSIVEGIWGNAWVTAAIVGVPVFSTISQIINARRK